MQDKRIKIVLIMCLCVSIDALKTDSEVMMETLPGYSITAEIHQLNSTRCRKEIEEYRDAVDRRVLWSLKMLDVNGQPSSGFIFGNNYWTGNRQQCTFLNQKRHMPISDKHIKNNSIYRDPAEEFPPFEVNFFSAHVRHNSTVQYHAEVYIEDIIVLGLCLPASCSENEVGIMLTKMFDDRLLLIGQLYSTDLKLIRISNLKDDYSWLLSGKIITILFIFAILLGTVIVGTLFDVFLYQKRLRKNKILSEEKLNSVEEKEKHVHEDCVPSETKPFYRIEQFLTSFSAYSNIKEIFNVDKSSEDLIVLHGLKFFGMIWIILAHSLLYLTNVLRYKGEAYTKASDIKVQVSLKAAYSVDTFFFVSGFLSSYLYLKFQAKKRKVFSLPESIKNFINLIVNRYIRLTPTYFVTILLAIVYFSWYEKVSLYYLDEPMHELCSKNWWQNILYINSFFDMKQMCMTHTWFISSDMQFYIFGSFLLTLSDFYYYTAISLGILALFLSTAVHGYMAYALGYVPTLDLQYETLSFLYMRPWMRIPPYIVGMGTAVFLTQLNFKLHLSKKVLAVCWSLSILCNCFIVFGIPFENMSLGLSVFYEAFSRFVWSLGIAWLVIACTTGNGGIVNKFLSLPYWIPFSKLSYCVYLLNVIIIMGISVHSNYAINFDEITNFTMNCGLLVMAYSGALILSVTVELPFLYLRSVILPKRRAK